MTATCRLLSLTSVYLVTTKYTDISDNDLHVAVVDLQNCHPNSGQVLLQRFLKHGGFVVSSRLRDSLKRVDPFLANARWNTPILQRTYHVPGPTHCGILTATTVSLDGDLSFTVVLMVT